MCWCSAVALDCLLVRDSTRTIDARADDARDLSAGDEDGGIARQGIAAAILQHCQQEQERDAKVRRRHEHTEDRLPALGSVGTGDDNNADLTSRPGNVLNA